MDESSVKEQAYGMSPLRQAYPLWRAGQDFPELRAELDRRICAVFGLPSRDVTPTDAPRRAEGG